MGTSDLQPRRAEAVSNLGTHDMRLASGVEAVSWA